jgi:hypothetical protein
MKENIIPLTSDANSKDFSNDDKFEAIDTVEVCHMTKEMFENDAAMYTDKSVTEFRLPELLICYKDEEYDHVIKDICIDDGKHSDTRISFENVKDDLGVVKKKASFQEGDDECNDIEKENANDSKSPSVKSSSESDSDHDTGSSCGPEDQLPIKEVSNNTTEESTMNELPQTSLKSLLESSEITEEQSFQIGHEEETSLGIVQVSEESDKSGLPNESELNADEELKQQPLKLPNDQRSLVENSGGNKFERDEGETSFSVVPQSGLITYSGPMIYSGNTSLRSDSSTTSTRSFAFPVLPNEWNSSPIRMAKAERHSKWKHGLLCCKF